MVDVSQLQEWYEEYIKRIARALGIPEAELQPVTIAKEQLDDRGDGRIAEGANFHIAVDPDYLKTASEADARGMIIHEITHAITDRGDNKAIRKYTEPLANAIRYQMVGETPGWDLDPVAQRLVDLAPWQMRAVQATMSDGSFHQAFLKGLEDGRITKDKVAAAGVTFNPPGGTTQQGTTTGQTAEQLALAANHGWTGAATLAGGGGGIDFNPDDVNGNGVDDQAEKKAARQQRRQDRRNDTATYTGYATAWEIPITGNIQALIAQANRQEWNQDLFLQKLRETQEYRERFKGIMGKNGEPKMDENTYLNYELQFHAIASQNGIGLGPKREAFLFRNNQTPEEFADRATAYKRIQRNPDLYKAYARELVQGGLAKPGEVDKKGLFKAVMGEAPQAWYDLWQDTVTRNAAVNAGISFKKGAEGYTNLGHGVIERISRMDLSEEEMAAKFTEVSDTLENVLGTIEAGTYGVSKKSIVKGTFGGHGAASARRKLKRAIDTAAAFDEERASSSLYDDGSGRNVTQGVSDVRKRTQSDY